MNSPAGSKLRRVLKFVGFGVAVVVTLAALVLAIENYRGKRAWTSYKAALEAKGESLDVQRLIPGAVPDEQNFWMTPLLRPFSEYVKDPATGETRLRDTNACEAVTRLFAWTGRLRSGGGGWRLGQAVDLAAWQKDLRDETNSSSAPIHALLATPAGPPADDLLFLLRQNQRELDELRAALARPAASLKGRYIEETIAVMLPQLAAAKSLAHAWRVAALAHLAKGEVDAAHADVAAMFRFGDTLANEPLMLVGLVRVALLELAFQPLWEGLIRHQWTERHLAAFEALLKPRNGVEQMARCLRGERAFSVSVLENLPGFVASSSGGGGQMWTRFSQTVFSGFIYQNQLSLARVYTEEILPAFDPARGTVDVARLQSLAKDPRWKRWSLYRAFVRLLVPAMVPGGAVAAREQATLVEARLAIALERHRLAKGTYPDSLAGLVPEFLDQLPVDPVNGQPMLYRREASDRFAVYSVGLNLKDDGGAVAITKTGSAATKATVADWVWQNFPITNTVQISSTDN